jgi:SAM-dependent methyltransferase
VRAATLSTTPGNRPVRERLDPVDAYDRIAPVYARIAARRAAYLGAVDRLILAHVPAGARTMLDVGAADGARAARIAQAAAIDELTLLEPSAAMRAQCPAGATLWTLRAEQLGSREGRFDLITCLWNVLGHIFPAPARGEALRQCARLVAPGGRICVDVSHRYNARHYGAAATLARFLRDRLAPGETNGDVTVNWDVDGTRCTTSGHVFTHREFAALARSARLRIERRYAVDYATGALRRCGFEGNLLYVLKRDA